MERLTSAVITVAPPTRTITETSRVTARGGGLSSLRGVAYRIATTRAATTLTRVDHPCAVTRGNLSRSVLQTEVGGRHA